MSASKTQNPTALILKVMKFVTGTQKDLVGKMTVLVAGVAMTSAQLVVRLQAILAAYQAVADARKALDTALAAWKAQLPDAREFLGEFTVGLKAAFGSRSPQLQDFGIQPKKAAPQRSAAEKAISAQKGQDTKAVHGTGRGKKQLKALTVTGSPGVQIVAADGTPGALLKAPVAPAKLPGGATPAAGSGTPTGK